MNSDKGKDNKHIETNHIQRTSQKCPQCKKQFSTRNALSFHVSKHSCGKVDYATAMKWNLRTHIESIHNGKKYYCEKCDYEFTWKHSLQTHDEAKHEDKKYSCEPYDFSATQKHSVKTHIKAIHEV